MDKRKLSFNSARLAEAMAKRGWSYQMFCDKLNALAFKLGCEGSAVRPSNVATWLKGTDVSGSYLVLIATVLKLPIQDFYITDEQKKLVQEN